MNPATSVKYMDYYIPESHVSVDDVLSQNKEKLPVLDDYEGFVRRFKKQSGLDRVAVFDARYTLAKLTSDMMDKLLSVTGVDPLDIRYLVCGNPALMDDEISVIHFIHKKYNLEHATIIPIFQPCAASVIAMGLSEKLLGTKEKEYILVLTGRKCPDIKGRYVGFTIMGDGLALTLIENGPGEVNIKNWTSSSTGSSSFSKVEGGAYSINVKQLQMNIINNGVSFLRKSLNDIDLRIGDVDIIIHPNTNYDVWQNIYSHFLNLEASKFYLENIDNGGHINDVDLVRNAKDYLDKKRKGNEKTNMLIYGIDLVRSFDINYHLVSLEVERAVSFPKKETC